MTEIQNLIREIVVEKIEQRIAERLAGHYPDLNEGFHYSHAHIPDPFRVMDREVARGQAFSRAGKLRGRQLKRGKYHKLLLAVGALILQHHFSTQNKILKKVQPALSHELPPIAGLEKADLSYEKIRTLGGFPGWRKKRND
jgi:hypothetical protein